MKKDKAKHSAVSLVFTTLLYTAVLPICIASAANASTQGSWLTASLLCIMWIAAALFLIQFQFHHVDAFCKQRGETVEIAGILVFFFYTMFLLLNTFNM